VEQLAHAGRFSEKWSCKSHKSIRIGDRAFLLRLGQEPKGMMGSGVVATEPFLAQHWSGEDRLVPRVVIDFDTLLDPVETPLLGLDRLQQGPLANQTWTPQASGVSIAPELVPELEALWFDHLQATEAPSASSGGAAGLKGELWEGAPSQVRATRYERNPHARRLCIAHHGVSCSVCGVNFESSYGPLGAGFIHVHHLSPVSSGAVPKAVDPVADLRPVCPNCHAMLHRETPPMDPEELRGILATRR
jgi:5-methylcytosine-specific restriction protein A